MPFSKDILSAMPMMVQTADGFAWTSPDGVTGFVRAASPDTPAALPTERNSHAAVAIDSDLLILGGESNAELVQELCMIDTEKQVHHRQQSHLHSRWRR